MSQTLRSLRKSLRGYLRTESLAAAIPLMAMLLAPTPLRSQGTITTFAGNGATMFAGDGGTAINAALNHPRGLAIDLSGTIYIADVDNFRVRRVTPGGIISTFAGNGAFGFSGDGGLATQASFSDIMGLAVDASGNLFIADSGNRRIRKVTPGGIVSTVAGTGTQGFSGDGGQATAATLNRPTQVIVDAAGNLYFSDSSNQRIRRVGTDGIITTIAGNGIDGFSGDGSFATAASMSFPLGLAMDKSGNLFFADGNNNRIRKVTPGGIISTVAGGGAGRFGGDGGPAISASLDIPSDVAVDFAGNLYIADSGNNRVRKVDASGTITTIAGTGTDGFSGDGGPAAQAVLNFPWAVTTDAAGAVFIADRVNSRVRKISAAVLPPPAVQDGTAVNGASFMRNFAIAPGAIVTLFGSNLAESPISAPGAPFPTVLGDTSVTFNGIAAPLFFVSPGQINAQAPFEIPAGPVSIQVTRGGSASAVGSVNVANASPGIFIMDFNTNQGAILHANFSLVSSSNPARAGETLLIYATGLGPLKIPVKSGDKAPSSPLAETVFVPGVTVGGFAAPVGFSGLAPGFAGLYQVNIVVPNGLTPGTQSIQIMINGIFSNIATVAVTR